MKAADHAPSGVNSAILNVMSGLRGGKHSMNATEGNSSQGGPYMSHMTFAPGKKMHVNNATSTYTFEDNGYEPLSNFAESSNSAWNHAKRLQFNNSQ